MSALSKDADSAETGSQTYSPASSTSPGPRAQGLLWEDALRGDGRFCQPSCLNRKDVIRGRGGVGSVVLALGKVLEIPCIPLHLMVCLPNLQLIKISTSPHFALIQ